MHVVVRGRGGEIGGPFIVVEEGLVLQLKIVKHTLRVNVIDDD